MTIETAIYDQVSVPECTVTKTTSDTTGKVSYTAAVDLIGLDPVRSVTAEERTRGVTSLLPPTVAADTPNELIRRAVDAVGTSYNLTEGYTLDAASLAFASMRVGFGVAQALRALGVDV